MYTSAFVPAEWAAAHGLRPSRINPAPQPPRREGVCPYACAFSETLTRKYASLPAVFASTCDQMRRMAEIVAADRVGPTFLLNLPSTWQSGSAFKLYLHELRRLGRWLADIAGISPNDDDIIETLLEYDAARQELRRRKASLPVAEFRRQVEAFFADPPGLPPMPDPPVNSSKSAASVALLGGPLTDGRAEIFDAIADAGGRVALDLTRDGPISLPAPIDRRNARRAPLEEMAAAYFPAIPSIRYRPNTPFYQALQRELTEAPVRGVILIRHTWCDLWHAEVARLREWLDVPLLDLDTEGPTDRARMVGRLAAFLEMLQ